MSLSALTGAMLALLAVSVAAALPRLALVLPPIR